MDITAYGKRQSLSIKQNDGTLPWLLKICYFNDKDKYSRTEFVLDATAVVSELTSTDS